MALLLHGSFPIGGRITRRTTFAMSSFSQHVKSTRETQNVKRRTVAKCVESRASQPSATRNRENIDV